MNSQFKILSRTSILWLPTGNNGVTAYNCKLTTEYSFHRIEALWKSTKTIKYEATIDPFVYIDLGR